MEEADYKSTKELFGKGGDEKTLDNFIPKSESDFQEYAELISHKLLTFEVCYNCYYPFTKGLDNLTMFERIYYIFVFLLQKSYHYIGLLKSVMRLSTSSLKAADAKDVASSITAIANEKLKLEKEANAGKKRTGITCYIYLLFLRLCVYSSLFQLFFHLLGIQKRSLL